MGEAPCTGSHFSGGNSTGTSLITDGGFSLPKVKRPRGRPKESKRLTSFNSKRVQKKQQKFGSIPRLNQQKQPNESRKPLPTCPPAATTDSSPTTSRVSVSRPTSPGFSTRDKVEVTPEKVDFMTIFMK